MKEKYYMSKTEFAKDILGISLSGVERREKQINYFLPNRVSSPEDRAEFMQKLKEWEAKQREERQKKRVPKKNDF